MRFSWMDIAQNERGVKEAAGAAANPRIVEYHKTTTLAATSDEVPWCSSFLNWVMKAAKYPITKSAAARSWLDYGQECELQLGCIVVFRRTGGNHVGFCVGFTPHSIMVLGGNQSNEVNVKPYPRRDFLGARLPKPLKLADQQILNTRMGN